MPRSRLGARRFVVSRGTYGAPRIQADLVPDGVAGATKRIARVTRTGGVAGVSRRRGARTTRRNAQARPGPDRVERRFAAQAPNRLWVADITYVPTLAGFLYLAIVLDVFSRRVVGWAMAGPSPRCAFHFETTHEARTWRGVPRRATPEIAWNSCRKRAAGQLRSLGGHGVAPECGSPERCLAFGR